MQADVRSVAANTGDPPSAVVLLLVAVTCCWLVFVAAVAVVLLLNCYELFPLSLSQFIWLFRINYAAVDRRFRWLLIFLFG